MLLCPCMLLGRRHYINSRYDHFSFIHKQIRKWINIYWVRVLFNTPCDLPGLSTATQDLVLCTFKSKSNQKKKKDHESLVSDWLSLMGKKEKGWKIRPCVSSCPFLLQDGWKHDVWSVLGLDNSEPETGMGWAWKTEPGAKEKGHLRGKQADCPVTIWESLGTKQWKKKPDKNWK